MRSGEGISDEEAMLLHRLLAEYHRTIAAKASLTLTHHYHEDLCWRLDHEADQIQDRIVFQEQRPWQNQQT